MPTASSAATPPTATPLTIASKVTPSPLSSPPQHARPVPAPGRVDTAPFGVPGATRRPAAAGRVMPVPGSLILVLQAENGRPSSLVELLRDTDHRVHVAGDLEEAVRALSEKPFDLVLLDLT